MTKTNYKQFWENRAKLYDLSTSNSVTNLEENHLLQKLKVEKEIEKIEAVFKPSKNKILLDLGSGIGFWSLRFAAKCKKVIGVDFVEKMNKSLEEKAQEQNIQNLEIFTDDIVDFKPNLKIDYVFLSGVLLYLTDHRIEKLVKNIYQYTNKKAEIILRDSTGINGRYVIKNKYSKDLSTHYSAIYRSRDEFIDLFETVGFILKFDDDMFESDSPLNKWDETRLRVYRFIKK